jgi:oligopeptide transport system substrate-binding protein
MRRSISNTFWILLCVVAVSLSGCGKRDTNVSRGDREQVLHRGMGPALADLDPHLATGTTDYNVLSALFEGLVGEDPVDLHPVPGVAERWTISPDGLTYTFHLRANARWSNGDPLTARDFVESWNRVLTPSLGSEYANLLYVVAGAEAYHKGRAADFASVGIASPDDRTVRVTLEYPTPHFLSILQHWVWFPVHMRSISAVGSPTTRGTAWSRPGKMVSNGPFQLSEWRGGERIIATKNPHYWDAPAVRLQAIHFHPFESVDAEERAFRAGQLHLTDAVPISKIDAYRRQSPELLRIDPYLGTYFYRINLRRPFLNEQKVRRALALAVDRTAIVEQILRGGQTPATGFVPPGTPGYASPETLTTDFAAARRLLAEAGYPEGRGAPVVELLFNTSENHRVVAEAIQEMWRRELGLRVSLHNMENKSVLEARRAGGFQLLRSVWIGDYLDPTSFLDIWRTDSGNNYTGWASEAYDRLLYQAARTTDAGARLRLLQRAETLLLEDAPVIPIYYFTHVFLIQPSVRGWHPTLLDHHPYKHVWLEPGDAR